MMKRGVLIVVFLLVFAAAAGVWWMRRDGGAQKPAPSPETATGAAQPAPTPPAAGLGLRIVVMRAAPGASAAITARIFNQAARQAALDQTAAGVVPLPPGVAAPPAPAPLRLQLSAEEWSRRIRFETVPAGGPAASVPGIVVRSAPAEATSLDASTTLAVLFECPAASLPAPGTKLVAVFQSDAGPVRSNVVTIDVPPGQGLDALTSEARVARVLGDVDRLDAAAAAISAAAPGGVDGPYYRGLVLQARGDRAGALAAFRSALSRIDPTKPREPDSELVLLIRALEQGGR